MATPKATKQPGGFARAVTPLTRELARIKAAALALRAEVAAGKREGDARAED